MSYTVYENCVQVIGTIWWLSSHSGDFQAVHDFRAVIDGKQGELKLEFPWKHEDSEFEYSDIMYPVED